MLKHFIGLFIALCATAMLSEGCVSKWSPNLEPNPEPIQWVDQSNFARARHLMTIKGFIETGTSVPHALKYMVFGRSGNDALIVRPVAVAIGSDERIAIADQGQPCVHLYVPSEHLYRKISVGGKEQLRTPVSVAFDDQSRLYVSDSSNRAIYIFDRTGEYLQTIKRAGSDSLQRPTGLSYSSRAKTLYAVDTLASRVYAYTTEGTLLFSFGENGAGTGQFNFPTHITTAPDGKLYVIDAMNFRVQIFTPSGKFLSSFGRHGNGSGDFAMPKGIVVDKSNIIYIVDTLFDNIQLFNVTGDFLFTIGGRGSGTGEFSMPSGLYLDSQNKLYVCDTYNQRVQIIQITESEK
ncbi:MAG TPA: 6-bladed beta-propeller [Nitrospirota bacterium]|nr:6-bladed beta-propeller [Nitrospirota bacterium]